MKIKLKYFDTEQRMKLEKAGYKNNGNGLERDVNISDIRQEIAELGILKIYDLIVDSRV